MLEDSGTRLPFVLEEMSGEHCRGDLGACVLITFPAASVWGSSRHTDDDRVSIIILQETGIAK